MGVYKCMGMYDLFLCVEMEGLYHINQQLSELLACILLDDEVMFLVILERKVDMNWFLWGGRGNNSYFMLCYRDKLLQTFRPVLF